MQNIVKNTTFPNLLDLIAPHTCRGCGSIGKPLCDCCKKYIIKSSLSRQPSNSLPQKHLQMIKNSPLTALFITDKRESLLGELVYDFKFNSNRALAKPLAEILDQTLPKTRQRVVVVPLPTNTKHVRERGLDHTLTIAKNLAHLRKKNYQISRILTRNNNIVQVGSDRRTRQIQAKTAYNINQKIPIDPNAVYLLLDDILTTGASLTAAAKKLQQAGANKIIAAVLAVS